MAEPKAVNAETGEMLPTTVESHVPTTVVGPITALQYVKLANALFDSGLYAHLNNQGGVLAVLLDGVEKGIGIMTALQNMVVINKKLAYSAHLVMALAKQRAGVTWKVLENNTRGCKMQFNRPGFDPLIVSFTEADAQAAGLIHPNSGYTKYPADMYFARCGVKGCRRIAPDATCNLYSIEELSEGQYTTVDEVPAGGVVEVEGFGNQPRSTHKQPASKGQPKDKAATAPGKPPKPLRFMKSKYGSSEKLSRCNFCGKNHVLEGDPIVQHPGPGDLEDKWGHTDCYADLFREAKDESPAEPEQAPDKPTDSPDPAREALIEEIPKLEGELADKNENFSIKAARTTRFGSQDITKAADQDLVDHWNALTSAIETAKEANA